MCVQLRINDGKYGCNSCMHLRVHYECCIRIYKNMHYLHINPHIHACMVGVCGRGRGGCAEYGIKPPPPRCVSLHPFIVR